MLVTKTALPRRNFLRGAGITIGLPLLDAMVPALSAKGLTASGRTVRLGFVYVPNGVIQKAWLPSTTGTGYEFARAMKPLQPFRNQVLVLSNLMQNTGRAIGDGAGDHSRASATWLTGIAPKRTLGPDVEAGISADQLAANQLGKSTRLRSLELGLEAFENSPASDSGYNLVYSHTISWRTPTTPMLPEANPQAVFARLFGDTTSSRSTLLGGIIGRRSVLDLVRTDTARLRTNLGPRDRSTLDAHLDRIRDLERQVQHVGATSSYEERAKVMNDLMAMAFLTDSTRVATLMMGREGSNLSYGSIGVTDGHHSLTHYGKDSEKMAKTARINELHVRLFADLLRTMKSTPDGDGSLLDHTMLLFGSSLGDGNQHTHHDLPLVLAGGATCKIRGGKHLRYAPETPMNNLLVAMLNKAGVPAEKLGDSTGELDLAVA